MAACCDDGCGLSRTHAAQRKTLRAVLAINAAMFAVIVAGAFYSHSSALLSDSLDNLGDALTYGLSLYVVTKDDAAKARVALFKGGLILVAACLVLAQIATRLINPTVPVFELMGIFSLCGLLANAICLGLLSRHRHEDVNMSSVWECSRNDIASNLSVFVAAAAVWLLDSHWPDLIVAAALAVLLLRSALRVLTSARTTLRASA